MSSRALLVPVAVSVLLAGCGGGGNPTVPAIAPARVYRLIDFTPTDPVAPGPAFPLGFRIEQPSGKALTTYKRGAGPHTGVHLIVVRDDLSAIVHLHPPIAPDGSVHAALRLAPGRYRAIVDAYPDVAGGVPNFQLHQDLTVSGTEHREALPAYSPVVRVRGYTFTIRGRPDVRSAQPSFLDVLVRGPRGRPPAFQPWFGATAHAIFFRAGSLDYFHTHVCAAGATSCAGASKIVGSAGAPGELRVGALVPTPGTWRLFLQCQVAGRVLTAPFTLTVR